MISRLLCLCLFTWAFSGVAWGQDDGSATLGDVIDQARSASPDMTVVRTELETSQHQVGSALSTHLPRITASDRQTYRYNNPARYTFAVEDQEAGGTCPEGSATGCVPVVVIDGTVVSATDLVSNSLGFTAIQPVLAPRQVVGIRQAKGRVELAELKVRGTEEQLVLDLLSQYFALQSKDSQRSVYEASLLLNNEMEADVKVRFDTGQGTHLDVQRSALDVADTKQKIRQLNESQALDSEDFRLRAGLEGDVGVGICPMPPAIDKGGALQVADTTRLLALEQQVEMDRLSLQAARTGWMPTINVVGGLSFSANGETMDAIVEGWLFDNWYVGGTLSLSLFEGLGRYHSNQSAKLGLQNSQVKLSQERKNTALADQQSAQTLAHLSEDLDLLDQSITLSEANIEAVRSRYMAGTATFEMWVAARQSLESLRLQRVMVVKQQWQLTAYRWIVGANMEGLLEQVARLEADARGANSCHTLLNSIGEGRQ